MPMKAPKSVASLAIRIAIPSSADGRAPRRLRRRRCGRYVDVRRSRGLLAAPAPVPAGEREQRRGSPPIAAAPYFCDHEHREHEREREREQDRPRRVVRHLDDLGELAVDRRDRRLPWPSSSTSTPRSEPAPVLLAVGVVPVRVRARDLRDDGEVVLGRRRATSSTRASAPCHGSGPACAPAEVADDEVAEQQQDPGARDEPADRLGQVVRPPSRARPGRCRRRRGIPSSPTMCIGKKRRFVPTKRIQKLIWPGRSK